LGISLDVVLVTWDADGVCGPGTVDAMWFSRFIGEPIITTVVQHVAVVDERSDVESRLQSPVVDLRNLALACDRNTVSIGLRRLSEQKNLERRSFTVSQLIIRGIVYMYCRSS